jgi:putative N6-adenine-specific DNA methylase
MIQLKQCAIKDLSRQESSGIIVSNPPYGERLLEQKKISLLYREMGEVFRNQFPRSSYFIITPDERFENLFGQKAKKNRKLYNGALKCYLYQYF